MWLKAAWIIYGPVVYITLILSWFNLTTLWALGYTLFLILLSLTCALLTRAHFGVSKYVKILIIGAGPAGLACAQALGNKDYLLLERGKLHKNRNHNDPADLVQGVFGAGGFSDGKFSFFPSSSWLWQKQVFGVGWSYSHWLKPWLESFGVSCPNVPTEPSAFTPADDAWTLKAYPSEYASLSTRIAMADNLVAAAGDRLKTHQHVKSILSVMLPSPDPNPTNVYESAGISFGHAILYFWNWLRGIPMHANFLVETQNSSYTCSQIVLAGGRFMPSLYSEMEETWRRVEFGVRLETKDTNPYFQTSSLADPKYIYPFPEGEWRTFCCCRQGQVVETKDCSSLLTWSGRSDVKATEKSNIGFNVRILDEKVGRVIHTDLFQPHRNKSFTFPLAQVLADPSQLQPFYGKGTSYLIQGLQNLLSQFPELEEARVVGRTIEGVGTYPLFDKSFQVAPNMYVCGDATGVVRGLVASLLTGHIVGTTLAL